MPAKTVSTQLDTILTTEIGNLIGLFEVPHALLRVNHTRFHIVLGCDAAELLIDKIYLILVRHVALIYCDANHEIILVSVLHSHVGIWVNGSAPLCPNT